MLGILQCIKARSSAELCTAQNPCLKRTLRVPCRAVQPAAHKCMFQVAHRLHPTCVFNLRYCPQRLLKTIVTFQGAVHVPLSVSVSQAQAGKEQSTVRSGRARSDYLHDERCMFPCHVAPRAKHSALPASAYIVADVMYSDPDCVDYLSYLQIGYPISTPVLVPLSHGRLIAPAGQSLSFRPTLTCRHVSWRLAVRLRVSCVSCDVKRSLLCGAVSRSGWCSRMFGTRSCRSSTLWTLSLARSSRTWSSCTSTWMRPRRHVGLLLCHVVTSVDAHVHSCFIHCGSFLRRVRLCYSQRDLGWEEGIRHVVFGWILFNASQ